MAVIGMVVVGTRLGGVWPREVDVSYALEPGVVELEVDYVQDGEAVASARLRQDDLASGVIEHRVRLQPGTYQARITVYRADGVGHEHSRSLRVPGEGSNRFDLKEATTRSE
ncbi:MAG: hypothetical protein WCE62_19710 [Polyangiales bacterium]